MQSVHRASRPHGMAYFIIAPIIIILMNLKLCKFPRVHLTRFRLVQRQSATVTAHRWALSCTLSCAWFYCFLRSYKSTLQLCGLSEHVDVAFITNQKWVWLLSDCYVLWKVLVQAMRGVFQESCEYYIQCFLYTHNSKHLYTPACTAILVFTEFLAQPRCFVWMIVTSPASFILA